MSTSTDSLVSEVFGLSLSACVLEMALNRAHEKAQRPAPTDKNEATVTMIVTGSTVHSRDELIELIKQYRRGVWAKFPDLCSNIAIRMYEAGKLHFSQVEHGVSPIVQNGKIWVTKWDDIKWTEPAEAAAATPDGAPSSAPENGADPTDPESIAGAALENDDTATPDLATIEALAREADTHTVDGKK